MLVRYSRIVGVCLALASTGCADLSLMADDAESSALDTFGFGPDESLAPDKDVDATEKSVFWSLGGQVTLDNGEMLVPTDDKTPTLALNSLVSGSSCSGVGRLLSAETADLSSGDRKNLYEGWTVSIEPIDDKICAWTGPRTLFVGVGPTSKALNGPAAAAGVSWETSHGLYLQEDSTTQLWLVGLAGTEAQLKGVSDEESPADTLKGVLVLEPLIYVPHG
ncbi:MAG: hypothetical protein ACON5B_10155 [Myxococcota bacterium]